MLTIRASAALLIICSLSESAVTVSCPAELAERLTLADSDWVIETIVSSCSAVDPGTMEIVAKHTSSASDGIVLARFGEIVDTKVIATGPKELTVELPNLVDILEARSEFDGIIITYRFLPLDDPNARADYQLWLRNPDDPRAQIWYQSNIRGKINPALKPTRQ